MQHKTRIAMISEHASPMALLGSEDAGGQNVYVDELSKSLASCGYKVDVFTRRSNAESAEINQWAKGVRVINLPAGPATYVQKDLLWPYMPKLRDSFVRFAKSQGVRYDLIHSHFWMSGWVACELKQVLDVPIVQTFHALGEIKRLHQGVVDTSPKQRIAAEQRVVDEADKVLATCPAEMDDLVNYYDADEQRISIVPCGVNNRLFFPIGQSAARRFLGLDPNAKVILYVGRILPRKGVDNIIAAVSALVNASDLDIKLMIVGGESEVPFAGNDQELRKLAALATSLGIRESVVFTGRRQQEVLRYYYSAADVCVTTPWYEPFGMVPLESMACGTPVIASAVGGHKYTVLDGATGFLVPPRDPNALAGRLEFLLTRKGLRDELSARAIQRVSEFFTWLTVASSISGVYSSLISPRTEQTYSNESAPVTSLSSVQQDLRSP